MSMKNRGRVRRFSRAARTWSTVTMGSGAAGDVTTMSTRARVAASWSNGTAVPPNPLPRSSPRLRARGIPQVPRGQPALRAPAAQQHRSTFEPVEDLPRQLDRGVGDRDRQPADLGLGSHALARAEGLPPEGVE